MPSISASVQGGGSSNVGGLSSAAGGDAPAFAALGASVLGGAVLSVELLAFGRLACDAVGVAALAPNPSEAAPLAVDPATFDAAVSGRSGSDDAALSK